MQTETQNKTKTKRPQKQKNTTQMKAKAKFTAETRTREHLLVLISELKTFSFFFAHNIYIVKRNVAPGKNRKITGDKSLYCSSR